MDTTIATSPRQTSAGKTGARKLRAGGRLPAVVYGPGAENVSIAIEPRALTELFRKSQDRNTVVVLQIGDASVPCLVRDVQRHPLSREILHVDFYRVGDVPVVVDVPITTSGKAAGLAAGGRVQVVRRTLRVSCPPNAIPSKIDVDVTPLEVGDTVRASKVVLPAGVKLVSEVDYPVVTLAGKQKEREETPAVAAAAEGAAPAAPAAEAPKKK